MKWDEVERIFLPFHLSDQSKEHWVALEIDLIEWAILIYDSNVGLYKDEVLKERLKPVIEGFPKCIRRYEPLAYKFA